MAHYYSLTYYVVGSRSLSGTAESSLTSVCLPYIVFRFGEQKVHSSRSVASLGHLVCLRDVGRWATQCTKNFLYWYFIQRHRKMAKISFYTKIQSTKNVVFEYNFTKVYNQFQVLYATKSIYLWFIHPSWPLNFPFHTHRNGAYIIYIFVFIYNLHLYFIYTFFKLKCLNYLCINLNPKIPYRIFLNVEVQSYGIKEWFS